MKTYKLIFFIKFKNRLAAIAEYIYENSKSAEIANRHISAVKS